MRKYIVASHGDFAKGIINSAELIIGRKDGVWSICIDAGDSQEMIKGKISEILDTITESDQLIIMTDILGGNVTNLLLECCNKSSYSLITGLNLPMLLDVLMADETLPVDIVLANAVEHGRSGILNVSEYLGRAGSGK